MSTQPVTYLTPEQYLEIERKAESHSEYINGEMLAMSGGTPNHARIALNTAMRLAEQLGGSPCEAFGGDLRVYSAKEKIYPDIVVVCGPQKLLDNRRDTLTDATAIIESSARRRRIMSAEHHVRQPDASWVFREFTGSAGEIDLKSIACRLPLQSLYKRVVFEAEA